MAFIKLTALILAFSVQASAFSLPRALSLTRSPATSVYAIRGNRDFDWYDDGYYDFYGGGEGYYGWGEQGDIVAGDAEAPWSSSSPENIVPRGEAARSKTPLRGTQGTGQQPGTYRPQSPSSSQYGPPRSARRGQQNPMGRGTTAGSYVPLQMNTVESPWSSSTDEYIVPRGQAARKAPLRGRTETGPQASSYDDRRSSSAQYDPRGSMERKPQINTVESPWSTSTDEYIVPRGEATRNAPSRRQPPTDQQERTYNPRSSSSAQYYEDPRNTGPVRQSGSVEKKPQINTVESPWSTSTDEYIVPRGEAARNAPSRRQPPTDQQERKYSPRSSSSAQYYEDPRNTGPVQQRSPARGTAGPYAQPQMNTVEAPWSTSTDEYISPRGEAAIKPPSRSRIESDQQPGAYDQVSSSTIQYNSSGNTAPVRPARRTLRPYQKPQMNNVESPWSSSTDEYIVPRGEAVQRTPLRGERQNQGQYRAQASSRTPSRYVGPDIQPGIESPWSDSSTDDYNAPRSREPEQNASWRRQMETGQSPPSRGTMATERQLWTNYDEEPWPGAINEYDIARRGESAWNAQTEQPPFRDSMEMDQRRRTRDAEAQLYEYRGPRGGETVQNAPWRGQMEPGQPRYSDTDPLTQTDDYRYGDGQWSSPDAEYFVPRGDAPMRDAALRGPLQPEFDIESQPPRKVMETKQPPFRGRRDTGLQAQAKYMETTSQSSSRTNEPAQSAPTTSRIATDQRSRIIDPKVQSYSTSQQIEAKEAPMRDIREAQIKPTSNDGKAPWSSSVGENIVPRDSRATRKTSLSRVEERNSKQQTSNISSLTSTYVTPSNTGSISSTSSTSSRDQAAGASKSRTMKKDDKGLDWGESLRSLFTKTAKALAGGSGSTQNPSNGSVSTKNRPLGDKPPQGNRISSSREPTRQEGIVLNEAESPGAFVAPNSGSLIRGGEPIRKMSPRNTSKGGSRVGTTRLRSMMLNDVESPWTSTPTEAFARKGQAERDYPSKSLVVNATKVVETRARNKEIKGSINSAKTSAAPALVLGPDGSGTFDRPARKASPRNNGKTVADGAGFLDEMECPVIGTGWSSAQAIMPWPPSSAPGTRKTPVSFTASVDSTSVSVGGAVTELYPRGQTNKTNGITSKSNTTAANLASADGTSVPIVGAVMELLSRKKAELEPRGYKSTRATSSVAPSSSNALVDDTSVPVGAGVREQSSKRGGVSSTPTKAQASVDDTSISIGGTVAELAPRAVSEARRMSTSANKAQISVDDPNISVGGAVAELPTRGKTLSKAKGAPTSSKRAQASVDGTSISVGGAVTEFPPRRAQMTESRSLPAPLTKHQASVDDTTISVSSAVTDLSPRKAPKAESRSLSPSVTKPQASVDGTTISVSGAVTELPPRRKVTTEIKYVSASEVKASVDDTGVFVEGGVKTISPRNGVSQMAAKDIASYTASVDGTSVSVVDAVTEQSPRDMTKNEAKGTYTPSTSKLAPPYTASVDEPSVDVGGSVVELPPTFSSLAPPNATTREKQIAPAIPAPSSPPPAVDYMAALSGGSVKKAPPRGKPKTASKGAGYLDNMTAMSGTVYKPPASKAPLDETNLHRQTEASTPADSGSDGSPGANYISALGGGPVRKMPPRGKPKTASKGTGYLHNMGKSASLAPALSSKTSQEASKAFMPPSSADIPPPTVPKPVSPLSAVSEAPETATAEVPSTPRSPAKIPRPAPPAAKRSDVPGETSSDYLSAFKSMRSFFGGAGTTRGTASSSGSASYLRSIGSGAAIKRQTKTGDKPKAAKNAMGSRYLENMSTPRVAKDWSTARGSSTTLKDSQSSSQPVVKAEAKVEPTSASSAAFVPRDEPDASGVDMPKTEAFSSSVPDPVKATTKTTMSDIPKTLDLPKVSKGTQTQVEATEMNGKLFVSAAAEQKGEYEDDLELEEFEPGLDPGRFLVLFGINLGKVILIMIFLGLSYDLIVTSMPVLLSSLGVTSAHAMGGDTLDSLPKIAEQIAKHPPAGIFPTDDLNDFKF